MMKIEVHKGKGGVYGLCEDPANLPQELGPWDPWKSIDAEAGQKRIGVDIDQALSDIQEKGYHLAKPVVTSTVTVGGKPA